MDFWEKLLWEEGGKLDVLLMTLRAMIVFVLTFIYVRVAKKRFLGRNTAFDIVLSIIMGSLLARSINGSAPFLPTAAAGLVIIWMHHIITYIIAKYPKFEPLFEGKPQHLIKDGKLDKQMLLLHHLTEMDVLEAMRKDLQTEDFNLIEQCYLENNGKITVVKRR